MLYNRTHSGNEQAPLPFDAQVDDVVLSAQSIYNPFGSNFGGLAGTYPNFLLRLSSIGDRINDNSVDQQRIVMLEAFDNPPKRQSAWGMYRRRRNNLQMMPSCFVRVARYYKR